MTAKESCCVLLKGNIAPDGIFLCTDHLPEEMWIVRGIVYRFPGFPEAGKALAQGALQRGGIILTDRQDNAEAAEFWAQLKSSPLAGQVVILCAYSCRQAMEGAVCLYWTTESPPQQLRFLLDGDVLCYDLTAGKIHLDLAEEGFAARMKGEKDPFVVTPLGGGMYSLLSRYSRMFLIEGESRALLIDGGFPVPDLQEVLRKLTDKPVELALTHCHHDHVGNVPQFPELWVHPLEEPLLEETSPGHGRIRYLSDGQRIPLGGRDILVLETPGHTPGSVSFYDQQTETLFPGDVVASLPVYMFLKGSCLEEFCASLERLARQLPDLQNIYPAHGKLHLDRSYLLQLLACAREVLAGTSEGCGTCVSRVPGTCRTYKHGDCAIFYCADRERA